MLHAGFGAYLSELKSKHIPNNPDGSVSLIFDQQYRVTFLTLAHADLLLEARLCHLPDDTSSRRTIVEMLLEQAGSMLETHTEHIVVAPGGQTLLLQQIVPAHADRAQFSTMLDSFVNALAGWRRLAGVL